MILAADALALPTLPAAWRVTLINTVPSAIAELVRNGGIPDSVTTVNLAGERLSVKSVNDIYAATSARRVYDLYGPSEDTTYSTWALRLPDGAYTIGRPIANTQVHVVDQDRQPVPVGVPGEIYLGGKGLTRGYLNRPDLTAERFVPNPFSTDAAARLYRAGDLARWRPDGTLEFLGRVDSQVKLRGFRIELGEIEATLERYEAVADAAVAVREVAEGDTRLVAYVVPVADCDVGPAAIRSYLGRTLPGYMVPGHVVILDAIPLTPNGKVDHQALSDSHMAAEERRPFTPPQTETEKTIAEIWQRALRVSRVGRTDNFFELGGHSLVAVQVIIGLREQLDVDMSLGRLLEVPTVEQLAQRIEAIQYVRSGAPGANSNLVEIEL